jgi:hypothetical protein
MNGYASGKKHGLWRQTTTAKSLWRAKTLRAAWLLALDFVVAGVTARCGDAPPAPADDRHHSPKAKILNLSITHNFQTGSKAFPNELAANADSRIITALLVKINQMEGWLSG